MNENEDPKSREGVLHKKSKREYLRQAFNNITGLVHVNSFRQQKLPAWRPILTIYSVVVTFMLTAIALIIIGAGFIYVRNSVQVFTLDYTYCMPPYGSQTCAQILTNWHTRFNASWPPPECTCWYKFELPEAYRADVYVYYALSNYFQNHLHYIRSKDLEQFYGERSASFDCNPFRTKLVRKEDGKSVRRPIVPCGTIANSMFNDTFAIWLLRRKGSPGPNVMEVPLLRTGIAWSSDSARYYNPTNKSTLANFTNPPYWGNKTIWDLDPSNPKNNGLQNEALIVWMRVSAFPDFWKLYARVNHRKTNTFARSIPSGEYYLKINYNYPVQTFKGRKSFILANTNKCLGNSYLFLAIIYLVVGGLCVISTIILTLIHKKFGMSKQAYMELNEKTPYFGDYRKFVWIWTKDH